jgi:hypothetical protein
MHKLEVPSDPDGPIVGSDGLRRPLGIVPARARAANRVAMPSSSAAAILTAIDAEQTIAATDPPNIVRTAPENLGAATTMSDTARLTRMANSINGAMFRSSLS